MQSNISGFENLAHLANINKIIDEEEILRYMKLFDVYKYKDIKFKKILSGMKKKLALIQAVMENQDLMIFDEPLNGDFQMKKALMCLSNIWRRKKPK